MNYLKWARWAAALAVLIALPGAGPMPGPAAAPVAMDADWFRSPRWDDGRAELSTYTGTTMRYGQPRPTTARIILVKEDLVRATLVKSDAGPVPGRTVEVLKHVFVADFPTGTYAYHQVAMLFFARGTLEFLKEVMSHSESCGITFVRIANERGHLTHEAHSYWDGEADRRATITWPAGARPRLAWDALPVWLRSLPRGEGADAAIPIWLLPSQVSGHAPLANTRPVAATVRLATPTPQTVRVPVGAMPAYRYTVETAAGRDTFWIAAQAPHPLVRLATAAGRRLELVKTQRLDYWNRHAVGDERLLD